MLPSSLAPAIHAYRRRAILLRLGLGLALIALIGGLAMAASAIIVAKVQGSASAINVSGSLRMQSHRMGNLVLASLMAGNPDRTGLQQAFIRFEASLAHESLVGAYQRDPEGEYARLYGKTRQDWNETLKPLLLAYTSPMALDARSGHRVLLEQIESFVSDINRMVETLEQDTEEKIRFLRRLLGAALVLTLLAVAGVLFAVRRLVFVPLDQLVVAANRIARRDFSARAKHVGPDELGQVGRSFNLMADELTKLYQDLEQRVNEKTRQLTRSNRSLELLYHSISRLYNAPVATETYRSMLEELEAVLGLRYSMACLLPEQDGQARVLASTLESCPGKGLCENMVCADCAGRGAPWTHAMGDGSQVRSIPLRDGDRQYGVLQITLPPQRELEDWEIQLVDALSQHIGIAIGIADQAEQERRLALMDERSVIARELHDSLAQALSYMKIQVSLLQQALDGRRDDARTILADLREGINAAYRQLRELLATFRLRMQGDFRAILKRTTEDYAQRGGLEVHLETRLAGCHLSPNQEIHVVQIVREALNNILRHAGARNAWVRLSADAEQRVCLTVDDDGIGIPAQLPGRDHYGLTIMGERAQSLHGDIHIAPRPEGGTRVSLRFHALSGVEASPFEEARK